MFHTYRKVLVIASIVFCLFSIVSAYSGGTGEPNNPYQIADVNDLLALSNTPTDYNKCFILTADINMAGQVFTTAIVAADTNSEDDFQGTVFTGTFDGNGHKITHFTINGGSNDYLGLFGDISSASSVKNLGIENCFVSGDLYVGGLVGSNDGGNISNCYSTSAVSGSSESSSVGGLVGDNYHGDISNCYSMGAVSGSRCVGGLAGYIYEGSISNCYSMGTVNGDLYIGGLVGDNVGGSISNCYSTGAVSGFEYVGGLVGYNIIGGSVICSFWDVNTSGWSTSAGGEGKTTEQMQDINTFLDAGWDFINETTNGTCNYWQMPAGGGYPVLSSFNGYIPPEPSGSGTEDDPYVITDANDLGTIWYRPWAHYVLADDINLAGIQWSMAVVPEFHGALDGNGFCIKNLSINGGWYLGLFGRINSGSLVKNLGIANCNVTISSGSQFQYIGGLVGQNNSGSIINCYSTGAVSGSIYVGGLVGENDYGSISNCYSTGAVSGYGYIGGLVGLNGGGSISNCYSTGAVSGSLYVGGLVGDNGGNTINCYSTGVVSGSWGIGGLVGINGGSISNCYSTGSVSGYSNTGGLAGYNDSNIIASFWDVNTSGWSTSAGGEGKTTTDMKTLSTFTSAGWDFSYTDGDEADWFIQIDEYPILTWQISPADIYTDGRNNFRDFAVFAQYWMREDCAIYNYYCDWADLDFNGSVDIDDLIILMSYWLESGIYSQ